MACLSLELDRHTSLGDAKKSASAQAWPKPST
jgi:hypothetical protein